MKLFLLFVFLATLAAPSFAQKQATLDAIRGVVADNAKNAKRYEVSEDSIAGGKVVFSSNDAQTVATWLIEHKAYKGSVTMDGGYILHVGEESIRQGEPEFDLWVDANRSSGK